MKQPADQSALRLETPQRAQDATGGANNLYRRARRKPHVGVPGAPGAELTMPAARDRS